MNLIIIGGGDNAGAIIDLIVDNNEGIIIKGISDVVATNKEINGYKVTLTDNEVTECLEENHIIVSYARDMQVREKIYNFFKDYEAKFATLKSRSAYISKTSKLGEGSIVMPGSVIRNQVIIGKNTLINSNATIEHGCIIGDNCHIAPGAVLTGNVIVKDNSFIGANSTILPNIKIGFGSIVGAGAVVTKSIPDNEIWIGNPAKKQRK